MNWHIRSQAVAGLVTVLLLFLGIGVFGVWGSLAGAVVTSGQIELETHSQIVQHPDGGVVEAIFVRDGDKVRAEDVLLVLDGGELQTNLAMVENQLVELAARSERLKAEQLGLDDLTFPDELAVAGKQDALIAEILDGQTAVFNAGKHTLIGSVESYREQQKQIQNEISGLKALSSALGEQAALVGGEYENAATLLEKGLTQAARVSELKRTIVSLMGQKAQTEASVAASLADIARLDVEVLRLTSTRQEKAVTDLRDIESRIVDLREQERAYKKKISRLSLRAPRDGVVERLNVHTIGAVIRTADPVLSVVPQDRLFTISAKVDANHVDSVFVGQDAILRFSSFDARTTPEISAAVTRVSADIVTDSRTGAQFYIAELVANPGEIERLEDKELLPGMPVEVYIQTGSRSPLSYMLKPFLDFAKRAFRE